MPSHIEVYLFCMAACSAVLFLRNLWNVCTKQFPRGTTFTRNGAIFGALFDFAVFLASIDALGIGGISSATRAFIVMSIVANGLFSTTIAYRISKGVYPYTETVDRWVVGLSASINFFLFLVAVHLLHVEEW